MKLFFLVVFITAVGIGCSSEDEQMRAHVSGNFSVADSIDPTGNFSGIGITIIKKDSANADADTLFHALTDSTGAFSGTARFPEKRQYPLIISRNNRNLGSIGLILADEDSVSLSGELPGLNRTLSVHSREHDALEVYQRVNRNFQRIVRAANTGILKGDSLEQELNKWSDLYWEVYQKNRGTVASKMAASESVRLLEGWNNDKMMKRIRSIQNEDALVAIAARRGKDYIANSRGLDPALAYLDTLTGLTQDEGMNMQISMERIKLLYDSARVKAAQEKLKAFRRQYADNAEAEKWAETIGYDLNYLSPGDTIPDFQFSRNGKTIGRDSLLGTPYILEVTALANQLYQNQFDRTVVIHSIYKNFGLQVITLPLDDNQVTIDAFFEERVKPWPVADARAFERQTLLEKFNIQLIPTRFLIDSEGRIVRKYVGQEYQDVIQGIQTLIKREKTPAS